MMKQLCLRRALALAVLSALSAGCTSVFPHGLFGNRHLAVRPAIVQPNELGYGDIEEGRRLLDAGLTGTAIEVFQGDLARGVFIAPAANGLGVAYARIGRMDLAVRYFTQASEIDPSDSRYAANLARAKIANVLAAAIADWAIATPTLSFAPNIDPIATATVPITSQLIRVSPHEVRLVTANAQRAPTYRPAQYAISSARPVIRITAANSRPVPHSPEPDSKSVDGGGRKVIMLASRVR